MSQNNRNLIDQLATEVAAALKFSVLHQGLFDLNGRDRLIERLQAHERTVEIEYEVCRAAELHWGKASRDAMDRRLQISKTLKQLTGGTS